MSAERPNILLIMTDQQRWDSLGCYGAHWVHTPNLDRLADEGARFDRCYVNNPICTPSRSSIWTGQELPGHGVYRLYDLMPPDEMFFPERLRRAGYRTALFGKLHTSSRIFEAERRHPNDGFDEYEWAIEASIHLDSPYNGYSRWLQERHPEFYERLVRDGRAVLHHPREVHFTHWAAGRTVDFIHRAVSDPTDAPFFVCMSVFDPHNPYEDYPLEMLERIDADAIPPPLSDPRRDRPEGVERERAHSYLGAFQSLTEEEIAAMRRGYFASVALIDLEVGRVLDALESAGITDDTLVIFTSDHGDMLGDHDLLVKGGYFYEACARVPFIVRRPRTIPARTVVTAPIQPHDIAATVCTAASLPESDLEEMPDSRDLTALARGERARVRDYAVCAYRNSGISDEKRPWDPPINATMITDGRYKFSIYHSDGRSDARSGELYDIETDPDELNDLYSDPASASIRLRLTDALAEWFANHEQRGLASRGGELLPAPGDRLDNRLSPPKEAS
jgi:arylsulfatase A-like enzyme